MDAGDVIEGGGEVVDIIEDVVSNAQLLLALEEIADNQEVMLDYVDVDNNATNDVTAYTVVLDKQDMLYEQIKLMNDQMNTLIELMSYIFAICCIIIAYYLLHRVISMFHAA